MSERGRETRLLGASLGQVSRQSAPARARVDAALAKLAVDQGGPFTLDQMHAIGLSPNAVGKRVAAGRLYRIHSRVYALTPRALLSRNGVYMAAVLACGPDAALSHASAAALLDLRSSAATRVDVSIPARSGRRHAGIRIHRATSLRVQDIIERQGIRCTSVERTIFDLTDSQQRSQTERMLDEAAFREELDDRALRAQIERAPKRRSARLLALILEQRVPGQAPTMNDFEKLLLALTREFGLPDPEVQAWIDLGDGDPMIQADFLWREQRVIVEADGFATHGTRQGFERDRRRDQRSGDAGWRTIRVTWLQLLYERERIGPLLLRALRKPRR